MQIRTPSLTSSPNNTLPRSSPSPATRPAGHACPPCHRPAYFLEGRNPVNPGPASPASSPIPGAHNAARNSTPQHKPPAELPPNAAGGKAGLGNLTVPHHADRAAHDPHPLNQRMRQILSSLESSSGTAAYPAPADSDHGLSDMGGPDGFWELLNNPEQEQTIFGGRARSATDANVLRRKGHLKEQDFLIDYMQRMHETHTCEEVMMKMERWIAEHRKDPKSSRLRRLVPRLGNFFIPLRLVEAFREYDAVFALSRRRYIPPNFAELRHIVNIAQVHASGPALRLITFDADGTLYADGAHFDQDNAMISHIINLMKSNVQVAIVTAAGYPGEAPKFERRLTGLLDAFRDQKLPKEITDRFHIMGGECNYLLRVTPDTKRLEFVPDEEWMTPEQKGWSETEIAGLLREAQALLVDCSKRLHLQVDIISKERSVGIVPIQPTIYEVLEDIALTVQNQLQTKLPFCAFNGGNDVFVDVGNKSLGLGALMSYLGAKPHETLHVGDRFTLSGNDTATRDVCSVLWVANPEETGFFIKMLLNGVYKTHKGSYIE